MMSMDTLRIGILYSTVGAYGALGRDCRDGAALAIDHLREESRTPFAVQAFFADPACTESRYAELADMLLREGKCRHIVGTTTSRSRKDIIPLVEKRDGLLWYVSAYEGFEANENVIYLGACPNQHLLPLFDLMFADNGPQGYLLGSNCVWGWEMNRIARELLVAAGGKALAERYLPVEETQVGRIVADIAARRPDFVLNNLIGPARHAFLRAMRHLAERDPGFRPDRCPIVSCDLTECELAQIGLGVADGHLAVASYFDTVATPANRVFKDAVAARFGAQRRVSSLFATAYATVRLCVEAVARSGTDEPAAVRARLHASLAPSVLGPLAIDPDTNHAALPFHLGRVAGDRIELLSSRPARLADPYLARGREQPAPARLRVVC